MNVRKNHSIVEVCIALLILLILWEVLAFTLQMNILPDPLTIIQKAIDIFPSCLAIHLLYSMGRVFLGLSLSVFFGAIIGYTMGMNCIADRIGSSIVYFTYPIPKTALLPAVMLLFGLGLLSKTIMIILIVTFQIILTVRDSIKGLPCEAFALLNSLGATKKHIFSDIIFPGTLPKLLTAIRLALGTAISILFFTETYGTHFGIGYFIMDAWLRMNYVEMYAGILLLSFAGFVIFFLLDLLECHLCRWQQYY